MRLQVLKRVLFAAALGCGLSTLSGSSVAQEGIPPAKVVSIADSYLNNLFVHQWVKLDSTGMLSGSTVGLEPGSKVSIGGMPVFLISNDVIVHQTKTDLNGGFRFAGVRPGIYALVARDGESIGAFSLHVLPGSADHLPSSVEVRVIRPAADATRIIRQQIVPGVASSYPVGVDSDPLGKSRVFSSSPIVVAKGGKLLGKLSSPGRGGDLSDVTVHLLRDGREFRRVQVSPTGEFSIGDLQSGVYGLIAAGDTGFAAVAVELYVPEQEVPNGEKLIALQESDGISVELAPSSSAIVSENNPIEDEVVFVDRPAGGMFGGGPMGFGGGGGGGGGGFGGGGWAGLAGIGGLIAAVAIIASDDDPQAVSPIVQQ
ncbi:hypothetical protein SH449x_001545 [Pirellulaceae bacterium SH449]